MNLLAEAVEALERAGIASALVGAGALAAHGVARSTNDLDLLCVDAAALRTDLWDDLRRSGATVDLRAGDADDPLAGVVRLRRPGQSPVDVVIGRGSWQRRAIDRAPTVELEGMRLRVMAVLDLILLKLWAGAPKDLWDVQRLLDCSSDPDLRRSVDAALVDLPLECRDAWRRVLDDTR